MKKYVFIGVGGILGAITRFSFKEINLLYYNGKFPLNTFIINIAGSLLLALIITLSLEVWEFDPDLKLCSGLRTRQI